jgi:hypothetical protein
VINQIKRIWLKKYDKGCSIKVDSHGMDENKEETKFWMWTQQNICGFGWDNDLDLNGN